MYSPSVRSPPRSHAPVQLDPDMGMGPGESALISVRSPPIFSPDRPSTRPLDSYSHRAAVSHEHILPHLPHCKTKQSRSQCIPDIPDTFPASRSHSSISFADVTLIREALECHKRLTLSGMAAMPSDTAWFLLFPFEVRPGLRLSHSTTLASPACHLSSSLVFWAVALESALLSSLEDHLMAASPAHHPHSTNIKELKQSSALNSGHSKPPWRPTESSRDAGGVRAGFCQKPPRAPEAPINIPAAQMQMLRKYVLMCGISRRVPIAGGVRAVVRGIMLRYRKQLPKEQWGPVCMQAITGLQSQLHARMAPWMRGTKHGAAKQGSEMKQSASPSCSNVATGATSCGTSADVSDRGPGLLHGVPPRGSQDHARHRAAHIAAGRQCTQSMHDVNNEIGNVSETGLVHGSRVRKGLAGAPVPAARLAVASGGGQQAQDSATLSIPLQDDVTATLSIVTDISHSAACCDDADSSGSAVGPIAVLRTASSSRAGWTEGASVVDSQSQDGSVACSHVVGGVQPVRCGITMVVSASV